MPFEVADEALLDRSGRPHTCTPKARRTASRCRSTRSTRSAKSQLLTVPLVLKSQAPEYLTPGQLKCMLGAKSQDDVLKCLPQKTKPLVVKAGTQLSGYSDTTNVYVWSPEIDANVSSPTQGGTSAGTFSSTSSARRRPTSSARRRRRSRSSATRAASTAATSWELYGAQAQVNYSSEPDYISRGGGLAPDGRPRRQAHHAAHRRQLQPRQHRSRARTTSSARSTRPSSRRASRSSSRRRRCCWSARRRRSSVGDREQAVPLRPDVRPGERRPLHPRRARASTVVNQERLPFRPIEQLPRIARPLRGRRSLRAPLQRSDAAPRAAPLQRLVVAQGDHDRRALRGRLRTAPRALAARPLQRADGRRTSTSSPTPPTVDPTTGQLVVPLYRTTTASCRRSCRSPAAAAGTHPQPRDSKTQYGVSVQATSCSPSTSTRSSSPSARRSTAPWASTRSSNDARALASSASSPLAVASRRATQDPVHDAAVNALGPEVAGIPKGEYHRAGQPCVTCHGGEGPASTQFAVAGTVFYGPPTTNTPPIGVGNATVYLEDDSQSQFQVVTNCVGNFWIKPSDWTPQFPLTVTRRRPARGADARRSSMQSHIGRDGSCARLPPVPHEPQLLPDAGAHPPVPDRRPQLHGHRPELPGRPGAPWIRSWTVMRPRAAVPGSPPRGSSRSRRWHPRSSSPSCRRATRRTRPRSPRLTPRATTSSSSRILTATRDRREHRARAPLRDARLPRPGRARAAHLRRSSAFDSSRATPTTSRAPARPRRPSTRRTTSRSSVFSRSTRRSSTKGRTRPRRCCSFASRSSSSGTRAAGLRLRRRRVQLHHVVARVQRR